MKDIIFEADVKCGECKGTGLYKGMAERGGSAVICYRCDGTGKIHVKHEYTSFKKRVVKENVSRVYSTAGGYGITDEDVTTEDGRLIEFSKCGCSYDEWLSGGTPKPIKSLHCPLQHYKQGTEIGERLKKSGTCSKFLAIGGYIPECAKKNREKCWEAFREQN